MINSIKYILKERKMQQKELINDGVKKQYISRWINRERKFDILQLQFWIETLNVPERFIIDDDGYCKLLNENEFQELKDYLFNQQLSNMPYEFQKSMQIQVLERTRDLDLRISKVQKNIRNDILNTVYFKSCLDNEVESALDSSNSNACFYEDIIFLHKNKVLNRNEWFLLIKALGNIDEKMSSKTRKEEMILINNIRESIRNYREYVAIKEKEQLENNHKLALEWMECFDYEEFDY